MKLFPIPTLEPGETIQKSWLANRTQSFRAVGGCLYLTNRRVVFEPNLVDINLGGKQCSIELDNIAHIGLEPGKFKITQLFDGSIRTRLRVDTKAGAPEFFVVNQPEEKQRVITDAMTSAECAMSA